MKEKAYYVLFHSHTDGLELYDILKTEGLHPRISPVPPAATACCGMSLLIDASEVDEVERIVKERQCLIDRIIELDNQIDANRDRFC